MARNRSHDDNAAIPLSRDRVLRAAIDLADESGDRVAQHAQARPGARVEAMSLYNHVANKDDILNGIVDIVESDIELPAAGRRLEGGAPEDGHVGPRCLRAASVGGEPHPCRRPGAVPRDGAT